MTSFNTFASKVPIPLINRTIVIIYYYSNIIWFDELNWEWQLIYHIRNAHLCLPLIPFVAIQTLTAPNCLELEDKILSGFCLASNITSYINNKIFCIWKIFIDNKKEFLGSERQVIWIQTGWPRAGQSGIHSDYVGLNKFSFWLRLEGLGSVELSGLSTTYEHDSCYLVYSLLSTWKIMMQMQLGYKRD